jgi:hypothetical protein
MFKHLHLIPALSVLARFVQSVPTIILFFFSTFLIPLSSCLARFQDFATAYWRPLLFLDIMQRMLVFVAAISQKPVGPIMYRHTPRNIQEEASRLLFLLF